MLMSAVETGQMSAVETKHLPPPPSPAAPRGLAPPPLLGRVGLGASVLSQQQTSVLDISISIHPSASAFSINNQHIMEAATAADFWLGFLAIASLGSDKMEAVFLEQGEGGSEPEQNRSRCTEACG